MRKNGRINQAIDAIEKVLKTLTWADFVQVLAFSDRVDTYGDGLLYQADSENVSKMADWATNLATFGMTDYGMALEEAFDLMSRSVEARRSSMCNRIMLFMSDGDITKGAKEGELLQKLATLNHAEFDAK